MTPIIVRLYIAGELQQEWHTHSESPPDLMFEVLKQYPGRPHMVEVEFPELPLAVRFLRMGTDPRGMVQPQEIKFDRGRMD